MPFCHNLTAFLLLVDDMLRICLSEQARLALHQTSRCWQKPEQKSTIATVRVQYSMLIIITIIIVRHAVTTEMCNLQHEQ